MLVLIVEMTEKFLGIGVNSTSFIVKRRSILIS